MTGLDFCDGYWTRPHADILPKDCNYGLEPQLYGFKTWEELCADCIGRRKAAMEEEDERIRQASQEDNSHS